MERKEEFRSYYDSTIINKLEELEPERKRTRNNILLVTLLVIIANFVTAFLLNVDYFLTACIYVIIAIVSIYMISKSKFVTIVANIAPIIMLISMSQEYSEMSKEAAIITSMVLLQFLSVWQLIFLRGSLKGNYVENYKETVMNLVTKFIDAELEYSVNPLKKIVKSMETQRMKLEKDYELSFSSSGDWGEAKENFVAQNMVTDLKEKIESNKINEHTIVQYESKLRDVLSRLHKKDNLRISNEDYIYGNYQQQPLAIVESEATYRSGDNTSTAFKGLVFMTSKHDVSDLEMFLKFKGNSFLNFGKNDFKIGNEQFDNIYGIECSNEENGLIIFNSFTVSKLLNYIQNTKNIDFAVYDNKIFVFIPKKKDSFEPKIFRKTLDFDKIYGYYKELQLGIDIINIFM